MGRSPNYTILQTSAASVMVGSGLTGLFLKFGERMVTALAFGHFLLFLRFISP